MDYVPYAVPFFLLAILLEFLYGILKKNNTYRLNDTVSSLFMGSLSGASKLILIGAGGFVFKAIEDHYALWRLSDNLLITSVFIFILYDLCYYWFHRISHERKIFWGAHVAHHQSEEYNLSTALRQTSMSFILSWVFYVPLFLIGVPAEVFVSIASINLIYQFWVHSQHVPKLGWFDYVFVSPSNHRVHHAQNDSYIDKNYGGVFVVWDRLFGTFQEELNNEKCVYGIRGPIRTFNPLWANVHVYFGIFKDILKAKSFKDKLYAPLSPTGWKPESMDVCTLSNEYNPVTFQKFDPQVHKLINIYAFIQLLILAAIGNFITEYGSSSYSTGLILVTLLVLTMVSCTQWLDGKSAIILESIRLIFLSIFSITLIIGNVISYGLVFLITYICLNFLLLPFLNKYHNLFSLEQ